MINRCSCVFLFLLAVAGPGQAFLSLLKRSLDSEVTPVAPLTPVTSITPAQRPCEDAAIIDCSLPGMCSDAEFASLLCPVTCGRCSNLVADCSSPEGVYCLTHPDVCTDLELAVIMCPYLCGFCGSGALTFEPPSSTTNLESTTSAPGLPVCPTCSGAAHSLDCLENLEVCRENQVCTGSVADWKLSMRCTSPLICGFEELQSNRNCTSGQAFAPQEHCTFCCQGDACARDLTLVQEGLDKIPTVLHCPACVNETDPRVCAERIVPCKPQDTCTQTVAGNNCRLGAGVCSYCCHTSECVSQALAVGLTSAHPESTSIQTTPPCVDADFYPCQYAKEVACADQDMSLTVCPLTCGRCGDL
ncbi:hypothetical protein PoB_001472600 [Plakobranchus ocellatus]|uniref:ShKT domain-containing protein n=1 Tax=Plakobranchus ocellatus TaxID=259542 RepID=A0AAV3YLS4_9GAST|nr:hypothetical protein PoB_001472600 [Plakobranchus ocellatus]